MAVPDAFTRAVRRGDSQLFGDVTLRNQSAKTDASGSPIRDQHGNIEWDTATTTDVPGELVVRGTPAFQRRLDGVDSDVDVVAWIEDPNAYGDDAYGTGIYGATAVDGSRRETRRATRIIGDSTRYVIRETFVERNGRLRCHGVREDTQ